jgi:hypothetical protein
MLNNSEPGEAIYEPFLGSGTTIIAAESVGRICLAIEIDPLYVDVAIRRWQAFTGKQATRQADAMAFDAIAEAASAKDAEATAKPKPKQRASRNLKRGD